jgi:hypothetical protein
MTNVDDYVRALERELRDQPRRVRRAEAVGLREHLGELPPGALDQLEPPLVYAREYRAQRALRARRVVGALRRVPVAGRIAIVALVVVIVASVAIPTWIAHYQPVTANVQFGGPDTVAPRQEHNADVFPYRDDGIIRVGIAFTNSGRFGATITGLNALPDRGGLKFVGIGVLKPPDCCASELAHPARFPVPMPAGTTRDVVVEFRMTNCEYYGKRDSVGYDHFSFPMTILGVHHLLVARLTTPMFIDMPGPNTRYCPRAPAR